MYLRQRVMIAELAETFCIREVIIIIKQNSCMCTLSQLAGIHRSKVLFEAFLALLNIHEKVMILPISGYYYESIVVCLQYVTCFCCVTIHL